MKRLLLCLGLIAAFAAVFPSSSASRTVLAGSAESSCRTSWRIFRSSTHGMVQCFPKRLSADDPQQFAHIAVPASGDPRWTPAPTHISSQFVQFGPHQSVLCGAPGTVIEQNTAPGAGTVCCRAGDCDMRAADFTFFETRLVALRTDLCPESYREGLTAPKYLSNLWHAYVIAPGTTTSQEFVYLFISRSGPQTCFTAVGCAMQYLRPRTIDATA